MDPRPGQRTLAAGWMTELAAVVPGAAHDSSNQWMILAELFYDLGQKRLVALRATELPLQSPLVHSWS